MFVLKDLGQQQNEATTIYYDNKLALSIIKNPVNHGRTKHMKIKYYFACDILKERG